DVRPAAQIGLLLNGRCPAILCSRGRGRPLDYVRSDTPGPTGGGLQLQFQCRPGGFVLLCDQRIPDHFRSVRQISSRSPRERALLARSLHPDIFDLLANASYLSASISHRAELIRRNELGRQVHADILAWYGLATSIRHISNRQLGG